jgi:hypothetical protein
MAPPRRCRAAPDHRCAAHRLRAPGDDLQQRRCARPGRHRRRCRSLRRIASLRRGRGGGARHQRVATRRRPQRGDARDSLGRSDRRFLHPGKFRARPDGRPPPAGRDILQHPAHDPRQHRRQGAARCAGRRRGRGCARAPGRGPAALERRAGGRAICPDQSRLQLCAIPAARGAAHGPSCGGRDRDRLCGGDGVLAPQPARLAALRRRQPARRPRRQARAPLRDLPAVDGGVAADHTRRARDTVPRRRGDDGCFRLPLPARLSGAGRAASAAGARSAARPLAHRHHRLAGLRLCRGRLSGDRHGGISAPLGGVPAAALVRADPVRPGGARLAGAGVGRFSR